MTEMPCLNGSPDLGMELKYDARNRLVEVYDPVTGETVDHVHTSMRSASDVDATPSSPTIISRGSLSKEESPMSNQIVSMLMLSGALAFPPAARGTRRTPRHGDR